MSDFDIVIVGAGHAGAQAAIALRQRGFEGTIAVVGDEPEIPYERPPLSKDYLSGDKPFDRILIRPANFWTERAVTMLTGRRVVAVDPAAHRVIAADGAVIGYRQLIWAAGGYPRRLTCSGHSLAGVHGVRSRADVDRMIIELARTERVVVIGGGYIGLEAAASAISLGASATIIERESRILARVACEQLASFFDGYHRAKGVEIITGAHVERLEGKHGRISAVVLADGRSIPCDAALVGIGGIPSDELGRAAGLDCENGIVVDENARTSDPDIYAIGDVAWRPMPLYGGRMFRLESVPNAIEQARRVAHDILGLPQPAHEVPWFWSDQFDLKLQIAGVPFDADELVVRGAPDHGRFAIFHLRDGHVLAVEAVNSAKDFLFGRSVVGTDKRVDPVRLADPEVPAKETVIG